MGLYTNIYWQMIISHFRVAILDLPHFQAHPFRRENRPCPAKPSSFSGLGRKFPCIEPGTSMMTLNKSSVLSGWTSMNPKSPSPLTSSMPLHFPFNSTFLQHTKKKTSKKNIFITSSSTIIPSSSQPLGPWGRDPPPGHLGLPAAHVFQARSLWTRRYQLYWAATTRRRGVTRGRLPRQGKGQGKGWVMSGFS